MENIYNHYQISKTLRFGLSKKEKIRKKEFTDEIYENHKELNDLVQISEKRIKSIVSSDNKTQISLSINSVKNCLIGIDTFISTWHEIYKRKDQIALDKDYYKILSKKIGFQGFWIDQRTQKKNPQSRIISLNELEKKDDLGNIRYEYIINYWEENLLTASEKYRVVKDKLKQFEEALKIDRSDNRPNEVEFRKLFLSLVNLVINILQPICLGQILFPKLVKLDNNREDNKKLINFATDHQTKKDLLNEINELKKYFEENGGNVPFCRATLNENTAVKNPKSTDASIDVEIKKLCLENILNKFDSSLLYNNYLENLSVSNKMKFIRDINTDIITRSLLFKYKPIPAIVQKEIAKTLANDNPERESQLSDFLQNIGQAKSPAKDYAELDDKKEFNLEAYPLKVAFDFAWESLAKSIYHSDIDFPKEQCVNLLKNYFGVQEDNIHFVLYAQLLELKSLISTLKFGNPNNEKEFKDKAIKLLSEIDWKNIDNQHKKSIENWLENKKSNEINTATQRIGLYRGRLKNQIRLYDNITKDYKDIAMKMGRTFAEMRDKITGAAELNKVTHYSMIIEDSNNDRYILLQEFVENKTDRIYSKIGRQIGDLKAFSVNSITSGAISKMIRKIKLDVFKNKNDIDRVELSEEEKEKRNIKEWIDFISDKRWDYEFKLNLKNKTFEEIKKEVDSKCYHMNYQYFNKETLEDLVINNNCLLLPIVNKDLSKESKTQKNQFTKDWEGIFANDSTWRLTPEFRVSYRKPTPNYPHSTVGDKRYSRFQIIGNFLLDYTPKNNDYISVREQISGFKDENKQKEDIIEFHNKINGKSENDQINDKLMALSAKFGSTDKKKKTTFSEKPKEKFYVFGIDRGQKELATLCVIDQDKKIIGDFDIYTRYFNPEQKQWEHKHLEKRHILDLSNLRVETTIVIDGKQDSQKVLVDLSEVKVKDKMGNYVKPNKMQIKMQQLAYIRKLQFQMQTNPDYVLQWYSKNQTKELIIENFVDKENGEKGLVSFYGSAIEELNDTLPLFDIMEILSKFKVLKEKEKQGENVKNEIDKLIQLEPVDNLKSGVVSNMIGVIAYLLKKFNYQAYISLEDLSKPFTSKVIGGIAGVEIKLSKDEGRRADVEKYAGLGLYNFFEMQLLNKLQRVQKDSNNILHLVPAFRAQKNYDHIAIGKEKIKNQFGIVFFVDANSTSKMCPICGTTNEKPNNKKYPNAKKSETNLWLERDKKDGKDDIICYVCGFDTRRNYTENPLKYIKSGDDNAAYLISTSGINAYELAKIALENK